MRLVTITLSALLLTSAVGWADDSVLVEIDREKIPALAKYTNSGDVAVAIAKVAPDIADKLKLDAPVEELQVGNGIESLGSSGLIILDASSAASVANQASDEMAGSVTGSKVDRVEAILIVRSPLIGDGVNEWPGGGGGGIRVLPMPPEPWPGGGGGGIPNQTLNDLIELDAAGIFANGSVEIFEISE